MNPDWNDVDSKVGPPRGGTGKLRLDVELIRTMLDRGYAKSQIAEYVGVSRSTVVRRLEEEVIA